MLVGRNPVSAAVIVKVDALDDPAIFEGSQMALFTCDTCPYHAPTEGIPTFERLPD